MEGNIGKEGQRARERKRGRRGEEEQARCARAVSGILHLPPIRCIALKLLLSTNSCHSGIGTPKSHAQSGKENFVRRMNGRRKRWWRMSMNISRRKRRREEDDDDDHDEDEDKQQQLQLE
eukprot:1704863-Pyramimonas_sp.AAC.1